MKLNSKLELKVDNFGKASLVTSLVIVSLLSMSLFKVDRVEKVTKVIEKKMHVRYEDNSFSEESLIEYLKNINMRFPDVVYAQAYLESGGFKSGIFKTNNNLFGMKVAKIRPTTAVMLHRGHALYRNWRESVMDYALYQSHYMSKYKTKEDYIKRLGQVYAEDPNYVVKLRKLMSKTD